MNSRKSLQQLEAFVDAASARWSDIEAAEGPTSEAALSAKRAYEEANEAFVAAFKAIKFPARRPKRSKNRS